MRAALSQTETHIHTATSRIKHHAREEREPAKVPSAKVPRLPGCTIDSAQGEEAVVTQVDITFVGREHLEQLRTHTQRLSRWQMRWGIGSLHGGAQGK